MAACLGHEKRKPVSILLILCPQMLGVEHWGYARHFSPLSQSSNVSLCYDPQFHLWKLRLRKVLGVAHDPTGVISGQAGIGATTARRVLSFFVSVPTSWPRVPAHRHSAGLCLFEVNSLEAAWLSPCLAGKGNARLLRPEVEKIWGRSMANLRAALWERGS